MSQDYFPHGDFGTPRDEDLRTGSENPDRRDEARTERQQPVGSRGAPSYLTVGSGNTSEHASRLQALLDNDSGYGGSIASDDVHARYPAANIRSSADVGSSTHDASLTSMATMSSSHALAQLDADRRPQGGAIHQLHYNAHRVSLARSISLAIELLRELQEMNATWPAHYPSVQGMDLGPSPAPRPGIQHSYTSTGFATPPQFQASDTPSQHLRRSLTSLDEASGSSLQEAESSSAGERRVGGGEPPRLVSPQIAREFSVLKLDLKLGSLHQAELVHSLEKASIASLLDGKISSSIKHLQSLRERIEDTSSKVLVTGDLNAGKSTFCNALLRRKILPEDQQPCTSIFCEVLDARANSGLEEVHAVHRDAIYNRDDESTYDVFALADLERIVTDSETYLQCKVYVRDGRPIDESLLNNGVVDIALIDAPGLNSEMTKTTAVFARQEEIDVVVFVLSAANHFTISARDFITVAAAEKAYLFIVVNGFDNIRDKQRCQKTILDQVQGLSPRTFKEAPELVHFVSSNAIPVAGLTGPSPSLPARQVGGAAAPGGGGDGPDGGDGDGNDTDADSDQRGDLKGKGKDVEKIRDFGILEQSLRRFVLEKRSRSKLAPAKNYLLNILGDINALATANVEVAQSELDRVDRELRELEPVLETSRKARAEADEEIDRIIEQTCSQVYEHTRSTLNVTFQTIGRATDLEVSPYPGIWGAMAYAEELKEAMLARVSVAVAQCEDHARARTATGVTLIGQLGLRHLGDEYVDLSFRPDVMFRRRRDVLARHADIPTELWDFIDWNALLHRQEKVAGTGMALTVATAVGSRLVGGHGWLDHTLRAARILGNDDLRRLIIPGIVLAAIAASALVLRTIPQSLPRRLATKISAHLESTDYVHSNSTRISGSVRKVLRIPADSVRVGLQRSVEQLGTRRDETLHISNESSVALKYFGNLVRKSGHYRNAVEEVDLDAHASI